MVTKMAKRKRGRPASGVPLVAFQLRIPAALNAALEEAARQGHRPKNSQIILALEQQLTDLYLWPPRPPDFNGEQPE